MGSRPLGSRTRPPPSRRARPRTAPSRPTRAPRPRRPSEASNSPSPSCSSGRRRPRTPGACLAAAAAACRVAAAPPVVTSDAVLGPFLFLFLAARVRNCRRPESRSTFRPSLSFLLRGSGRNGRLETSVDVSTVAFFLLRGSRAKRSPREIGSTFATRRDPTRPKARHGRSMSTPRRRRDRCACRAALYDWRHLCRTAFGRI